MRIFLSILFILVLLVSCSPTKPVDQVIKGLLRVKVLDSVTQTPVSGATVNFYYKVNLTDKPLPYPIIDNFTSRPNPFTSQASIRFRIFHESLVTMTLIDELVPSQNIQILKDTLKVGQYEILINSDSTYKDGFYKVRLVKEDSILYTEIFYTGHSFLSASYLGKSPLYSKLSNNDGVAGINLSDFPFIGKIFPRISETGQSFGNWEFVDSIRVTVDYKNGIAADTTVYADKENNQDLVIYIKK
jgi:hypothetical protein